MEGVADNRTAHTVRIKPSLQFTAGIEEFDFKRQSIEIPVFPKPIGHQVGHRELLFRVAG